MKNQESEPHIARFYREQAERAARGEPPPEPDLEWVNEYENEMQRIETLAEAVCATCGLALDATKVRGGDGKYRHVGCA